MVACPARPCVDTCSADVSQIQTPHQHNPTGSALVDLAWRRPGYLHSRSWLPTPDASHVAGGVVTGQLPTFVVVWGYQIEPCLGFEFIMGSRFCRRGRDPTPPEPRKGKVRQRGFGYRGCQMCIIRMRSVRRARGRAWGLGWASSGSSKKKKPEQSACCHGSMQPRAQGSPFSIDTFCLCNQQSQV